MKHTKSFSSSQVISEAFSLFKQDWVFYLAVTVINVVGTSIFRPDKEDPNYLISLVSLIVASIVCIGYTDMLLRSLRGEKKIPYIQFFRKVNVNQVVKNVVFNVIYGISIGLGFVLFIFPGIYIATRYLFVGTLMIDKDLSLSDAIKQSSEMTKGIKMNLFGYMLMSFGVVILGLIVFLVGAFVAIPVISLGLLMIYEKLLKANGN